MALAIRSMTFDNPLLDRAEAFAARKHATQKRMFSDEPYIVHLMAVAELVRSIGASETMIAAALLHDTLEDTATTVAELEQEFGPDVTGLVIELTNVFPTGRADTRAVRKAKEALRLAGVSADAQTIKVADLIDNVATVAERNPAFAKVYLKEKAALLAVMTKASPAILAMVNQEKLR